MFLLEAEAINYSAARLPEQRALRLASGGGTNTLRVTLRARLTKSAHLNQVNTNSNLTSASVHSPTELLDGVVAIIAFKSNLITHFTLFQENIQ